LEQEPQSQKFAKGQAPTLGLLALLLLQERARQRQGPVAAEMKTENQKQRGLEQKKKRKKQQKYSKIKQNEQKQIKRNKKSSNKRRRKANGHALTKKNKQTARTKPNKPTNYPAQNDRPCRRF